MSTTDDSGSVFSEAERAAMKARAEEVRAEKAAGKGAKRRAADEKKLLEAIAAMPEADKAVAERIHEIVATVAPELDPKTMYGMPAWAKDGKTLCLLQVPSKFESRYTTLSFEDIAGLDDGQMWPTSFALTTMNDEIAERIAQLVRRAVG